MSRPLVGRIYAPETVLQKHHPAVPQCTNNRIIGSGNLVFQPVAVNPASERCYPPYQNPVLPSLATQTLRPHMPYMRSLILFATLIAAVPAAAQDAPDPLFETLKKQLEALTDEARNSALGLFGDLAPLLESFGATLDDLSNYERPIILPNGDILFRRKLTAPALPDPPPAGVEEGSTDL